MVDPSGDSADRDSGRNERMAPVRWLWRDQEDDSVELRELQRRGGGVR